jgi:CheY-like chemotaxis protein
MLADVMMPEMDGFELMSRTWRLSPGMPVILMTGYLTQEVREKGLKAGALAIIAKPFTPEELLQGVSSAEG